MIGATPATSTRSLCNTPSANAGRTPGVDRVAAGLQNLEPGGRGEVMAGGDRVAGHGDRRAVRERFGHGEALLAYVAFCRAHSSA